MRGVFVTGTDTGAGKSVVAAAICAALAARGERVAAFKPVVTGLDDPPGDWPPDHELLAGAASAGQSPDEVAPLRFGPAVSPHLAAQLAGTRIEPAELVAAAREAGGAAAAREAGAAGAAAGAADARAGALVAEGVGGLMVPITPGYLVRDLAVDLGLPLVIAARPGLGTINHTLLTIEAARAAGLEVRAVVLTPWPEQPDAIERSNRDTIAKLGRVDVDTLSPTSPATLAEAASHLPIESWLDRVNPVRRAPRR